MSETIADLISGKPITRHMKTRIVHALEAYGIRTLEDLEAHLDEHSWRLKNGGMYRLGRLQYMFLNIGPDGAKVLRSLLREDPI